MRLHLFEFNDLPWLPVFLREGVTRYLAQAYRSSAAPKVWAKHIAQAMDRQGTNAIVDLCSGSGGPLEPVCTELAAMGKTGIQITQTDLFPTSPDVVQADARKVPLELTGVRTMFSSFHHFRPADAEAILRDARDRAQSICIFDGTRRTAMGVFSMMLAPIVVLVLAPRIRPRRWSQLFFTYLIPALPFIIGFDGVVSALRSYSSAELRRMTGSLASPGYEWEVLDIEVRGMPYALPAVLGWPNVK